MSTRAERRLKEATEAHQKAHEAHQGAVATFTALEAQADRGEPVDPLEYASAEGAVKLKVKHLERAQAAVESEQATVDEERSRARRRDIVQAAAALPSPEVQSAGLLESVREHALNVRNQVSAWQKVYDRVRKEIGLFPWEGETRAAADKASGVPDIVTWFKGSEGRTFDWSGSPMTDRFWLDGVLYRCPSITDLEARLLDEVKAAFRQANLESVPAAA